MAFQGQAIAQLNKGLWKTETSTSIEIGWDIPTGIENIDNSYYEITYRDITNGQSFVLQNRKSTNTNNIILCHLKSNVEYEVKGFIVRNGEPVKFLQETFKTMPSRIQHLIDRSTRVPTKTQVPHIYKLPCYAHFEEADLREVHILTRYEQPSFREGQVKEKTILVVGATGSGKSTFIDAMINQIVGVSFSDLCRFKTIDLTDMEKTVAGDQTLSQTRSTTCYRIPHLEGCCIDFALNIVDTPGFNDTRGRSYDENILRQIRKLFESVIHSLHAVCIVVQASQPRLTETQIWIFTNILKMFSENIKDIIYPCITYSDGPEANIVSALKTAGIQFQQSFTFSNGDLFEENPDLRNWEKRHNSFDDFFEAINNVEPRCIKNSERVLRIRENKTIQLGHIQNKIRIQVELINTIKRERTILQMFEGEIGANSGFSYEEAVPIKSRNKSKTESVNCTICEESCHENCNVPFDVFLYWCEVFHRGKCTVCTKQCPKDSHVREKYNYETVFKMEKRTIHEFKSKYQCAVIGKEFQRFMLEILKTKLRKSLEELNDIIQKVNELIVSLNKIALKSENFKISTYFDDLIKLEKDREEYNFLERIAFIRKIKDSMQNETQFADLLRDLDMLLQ